MEKAIKKAIAGGWKGEGAKFNSYIEMFRDIHWYLKDGYAENCSLEEALLDRTFWQALGKAEGWMDIAKVNVPKFARWGQKEVKMSEEMRETYSYIKWPEWKYHWHSFIDHLAEGKSPDDFFTELLK